VAAPQGSLPGLGRSYLRAMTSTVRRRSGRSTDDRHGPASLSADVTVDPDRLAAYSRVCGFRLDGRLPPTYPHVLGFPLQMALLTDPAFPFPAPGLVHVRNIITQHHALDAKLAVSMTASVGPLSTSPRGAQVELLAEARQGGQVVWESRSTYLARGAALPGVTATAPPPDDHPGLARAGSAALWRVGGDIGRRYAKVSGDRNPIHLHPWTARMFGFRRAIAHGMWTKARALSALEGRLPEALSADVSFRKPLQIPGTVRFTALPVQDGWDVAVWPLSGDRAHLTGAVRPA
jgi:acyl dehydratase